MFNQYYNQNQRYQPMYQPNYNQMYQQPVYQPSGINGRVVDNIEVVKATEITLDRKRKLFSYCRW